MWRLATDQDDDAVTARCLALNAEDPGPRPVTAAQVRRTLAVLRAEPARGRTAVLEVDGSVRGYALLIAFWSNELGGELCVVDELFVDAALRGRGLGSELFRSLADSRELWPAPIVALGLEVRPDNGRARALYERLGFRGENLFLLRPLHRTPP